MTSEFLHSIYNKTVIRFGLCDIQNNQGLIKGYQPQLLASADNPCLSLWLPPITLTSTLIILDITKTSSNNIIVLYQAYPRFMKLDRRVQFCTCKFSQMTHTFVHLQFSIV